MAAFERDYPFVVKGNARFLDQEFPSEVRLFFFVVCVVSGVCVNRVARVAGGGRPALLVAPVLPLHTTARPPLRTRRLFGISCFSGAGPRPATKRR